MKQINKYYLSIVFLHGYEADEPLDILREQGKEAAMNYLMEWDYGDNNGILFDKNPSGTQDTVCAKGPYVMTYNLSLGYIGLCKVIECK